MRHNAKSGGSLLEEKNGRGQPHSKTLHE